MSAETGAGRGAPGLPDAGGAGGGAGTGAEASGSRAPERFVETRAGGLFFINALLVTPALAVLFPLALKLFLNSFGLADGQTPILDTIPYVMSYAVPVLGWLSLIPMVLIVRNLRMRLPGPARIALLAFLLVHGGVLVYTASRWLS